MYRYSMTQWIAGDEPVEESFKRLKKYKYDGIELTADANSVDQDRIKKMLEKYNMVCTSFCGIFPPERNLCSNDPVIAENAVQYIRDNVDYAARVGAPYMIVVPSPIGATVLPEGLSYGEAWKNAVRNIRAAANYAAEAGVKLAIEAVNRYETFLVNTIDKAVALAREINHPAVGIMADLFHMSIEEGNLGAAIRKAAPYLMHVHIADNTREAAGFGCTDFKEVLYVLRDIGYEGPLTMEFLPRVANPYAAAGMETRAKMMDLYAEQSIAYMKRLEYCLQAESAG